MLLVLKAEVWYHHSLLSLSPPFQAYSKFQWFQKELLLPQQLKLWQKYLIMEKEMTVP